MSGEEQSRVEEKTYPWVWSTWVKAPILRDRDLLIASACLPYVNPELFRKLAKEGRRFCLHVRRGRVQPTTAK